MAESGRVENESQATPIMGLRSRGEPGQATVAHSVKLDNFVLGKGSLKTRMGLKKVTASKIGAPSHVVNGFKSSYLRLRTNEQTGWPDLSNVDGKDRRGSFGLTFRAKLLGTEDAAPCASKEIYGWANSIAGANQNGPQELLDAFLTIYKGVAYTFAPGPVVCLAATTDPYHVGSAKTTGAMESCGFGVYLVQDANEGKWYALLIVHMMDASLNTQAYTCLAPACTDPATEDSSFDPFEPHTYTIVADCDATDYTLDKIYLRIDNYFGDGTDTNHFHHVLWGAKSAVTETIDRYIDLDKVTVYVGCAPDCDHHTEIDVEVWNPEIWEFGPSCQNMAFDHGWEHWGRRKMLSNYKIHLPAHAAIADLAVWDITTAGNVFSEFWTFFTSTNTYYQDRIDAGEASLILLYPLFENRGWPSPSAGDNVLDVMAASPLRVKDGWATGVDSIRFGGVAPIIVPNGDLYRQQFGGKRGVFGHLYARDKESFFVYWKIDSSLNPEGQVIASFISPLNVGDGCHDQSTYQKPTVRGYTDAGCVHWGIKLVFRSDLWTHGDMPNGDACLMFFARGRDFDPDDHTTDTIKYPNAAVYGTSTGQFINLGANETVRGKRFLFSYSRVASWDEDAGNYTNNVVSIAAYTLDAYGAYSAGDLVGVGTINLGPTGDAHLIHEITGGADNTNYNGHPVYDYDSDTSLIPTWLTKHIGLKKYYLVIGGWIQPGWSGPEDITDCRNRLSWSEIEPTTFRTEEISYSGQFPAAADKIAGQPDDQEGWIGIPDQGGGLHSLRFSQEQQDDVAAVGINSVDRSRMTNVSARGWSMVNNYSGKITFTPGGNPETVILLGPGAGISITIPAFSGADVAGQAITSFVKNSIPYVTVERASNTVLKFYAQTTHQYTGGVYFPGTAAGSEADTFHFEKTSGGGGGFPVTLDPLTGYFYNGTGDPRFHFRHTIIGAVGATCGFGYLSSLLSDDDLSFMATEGHVTDDVIDRLKAGAISIWDCQEGSGGRLVDRAGSNTISDGYLFPIIPCPKTVEDYGTEATVELDIHHALPWGLYAFTERYGIRRSASLYSTDTATAQVVGIVETRERGDRSRQYVVSSAGIFEIVSEANKAGTYRHIGDIPGEMPEDAVVYSQLWGEDVYFCCGAGRPMRLTPRGIATEVGRVEYPRIWWNPHQLCGTSTNGIDTLDFYCHNQTDDDRTSGGYLNNNAIRSGDAGIFGLITDLHPRFPTNATYEPDSQKRWQEPQKEGFSYTETYHAGLVPKAQTAPNMSGQSWVESPLYDMPPEENVPCVFYWFITGVNKSVDPPIETPRSPIAYWTRRYNDTGATEGEEGSWLVGFFTQWYNGEAQTSTYAKIIHSLTKSPSPDITHIRVYRTPRGGGDFYLEGEYPIPMGYGSDGQVFRFDVCNKADKDLNEPNVSLNNYPPPSGLKYLAAFRGRMFYGGDPSFPWRLYYSAIDKAEAVPPIYYKNLLGSIVGMKAERDRLVVTTDQQTYEVVSSAVDYDEVTTEQPSLAPLVQTSEIKAHSGCIAGRSMTLIDDVGLVLATQRSVALLVGQQLIPLSRHIEGFSDEDRPSANLPTSTDYRVIYPQALNVEKSHEWVAVFDRFNSAYILFASLYGDNLGNKIALVWYPNYSLEEVSGEFSTYSFLSADSPASAETGGLYVADAKEVRNPLTQEIEIWVLCKNGYVYKLHSGRSDGVDYVCLEGTAYENLAKRGICYEGNSSLTAPLLRWAMPEDWESPLAGFSYTTKGRGADADVVGPDTLFTALASYGIAEPFVGAPISFTKDGVTYRRIVTAISTATATESPNLSRTYLVPTLNAALPEIVDEEWEYEFGAIYAERMTGKGGLWQHNRTGQVLDIGLHQRKQDYGGVHNEYRPADLYNAYVAHEGSVASGYIIDAGALNPNFSGWARVRDTNEWNGNVENHPEGAISWPVAEDDIMTGAYLVTGNFSYYAGWPCVKAGVRGNPVVTISHLWTDFEIWIPENVWDGTTPNDLVVMSKTEEYTPTYDADFQTEFETRWWKSRVYQFIRPIFLNYNVPVIVLKGINNSFPLESYCADEPAFINACMHNYFDNAADIIHGQMNSAQLFGYWTGMEVLKYALANGPLAVNPSVPTNWSTFGQSLRGTVARRCSIIIPECDCVFHTGSSMFDYGWYMQRDRGIGKDGLRLYGLAGQILEKRLLETDRGRSFVDFYGMAQYGNYFKQKGCRLYGLLQTEDNSVPVTGGEFGAFYNSFGQRERPIIGSRRLVTGASQAVANLLGPGESYDLPTDFGMAIGTLGYAGIFPWWPLSTSPGVAFAGTVTGSGGFNTTFATIEGTAGPYAAYFGRLRANLGAGVETIGLIGYFSSLMAFDTDLFTTRTGQTLTGVTVTGYTLNNSHYANDLNLVTLGKNYLKYDAAPKAAYIISGVALSWDKPNAELDVAVSYTTTPQTIRIITALDDPSSFSGVFLFQDPDNRYIKTVAVAFPGAPASYTISIPIADLGISTIDTETKKLMVCAEASYTTGLINTHWAESSRVYVLNVRDLSEYRPAYYLAPEFREYAEYIGLSRYDEEEIVAETLKATTEHAKLCNMKATGSTFQWGIRSAGADKPIEIFGDALITHSVGAARSG